MRSWGVFRGTLRYLSRSRVAPLVWLLAALLAGAGGFVGAMRIVAVDAWQRGRFLPSDRPPSEAEGVVAVVMEYATQCSECNDVIALGDSTCFCGFAPLVFEQYTGLRAYNLGLPLIVGSEARQIVLQRYLHNHPRPRLIVLAISPIKLTLGQETARMKDVATEQFTACYGEHHPSTWQRVARVGVEELRELLTGPKPGLLTAPLVEPVFSTGECYHAMRQLLRTHRGHRPCLNVLSMKPAHFEAFALTDATRREAAEFLTAADGIPVAIVFTPTTGPVDEIDPLVAGFKQLGYDVRCAKALDYPSELFDDFVQHLNRDGAQRFTRLIAESFCGDDGPSSSRVTETTRSGDKGRTEGGFEKRSPPRALYLTPAPRAAIRLGVE
jgi:hypothetical protein